MITTLRGVPSVVQFDITNLNTMSDPSPHYRDETPRIRCQKCGHLFLIGVGMFAHEADAEVREITEAHLRLCEGDAAVTLTKVEEWWKSREIA